jgi:predicted nucleic-acid-binding protein
MMSGSVLGADTNVLLRFVTRDDPIQSPKTRQLFTDVANQPIRICVIALVEMVWVLHKGKRWPMSEVLAACLELLNSSDFEFEEREMVIRAIDEAQQAGCDLADALIALFNHRAGCESTATFDGQAQGLALMTPVEQLL